MILFGTTTGGAPVHKITLAAGDLTVDLLTWGAVVQDVRLAFVPYSLTQGSDTLADYEGAMRYHGALIGPVANRISGGRATIAGMTYELERNFNGRHFLHSGKQATHLQVWRVIENTASIAVLAIDLPDGACGLPGNRKIMARFEVTPPASLTLTVTGTTDALTLMNFANHSYWNFDNSERYDGHVLKIDADRWLPATDEFYPTGDIAACAGTEMDFREPRKVSVHHPDFDNNFCLSDTRVGLRDVLWLRGTSGVGMTMATTEPGMQVYDGRHAIRPGKAPYEGLAVEAQFWPDATNNRRFPSILLAPDQTYEQVTRWSFAEEMDF